MYQDLVFTLAYLWNPLSFYFWFTISLLRPFHPPSLLFPSLTFHSSSLGLFPSTHPFPRLHLLMLLKQTLWCSCHSLHHFPGLLLPPGGEPRPRVPWAAPTQGSPRAHAPHLVQRGFTSLCVSLHHCWLRRDLRLFLDLVPSARSSDLPLPCLWCVSTSCN